MSYRELRNLTETLRALDFPRLVSVENFRQPNFKLVAEILAWLVKKYEADYDLPLVIDTEQDRVIFIKTSTLFMIQKARIKVNPKKLYQADGYAAQELLKVTSVLYEAAKHENLISDSNDVTSLDVHKDEIANITNNINAKLSDLRLSRQLASEIPEKGATLYDLLTKEVNLREQRLSALARPLELNEVEKSIRHSIRAVEDETKQMVTNLANVSSDEQTLDAKIEKKKADLDRQQKRLAQLQSHRPAYMDEYERLETHMKALYSLYVQKFRNVTYIEQLLVDYDKVENERNMEAELSLRKMAEKQRESDRDRLAMAEKMNALVLPLDNSDTEGQTDNKAPKVQGNITGAGLSDDDTDEDDDDNESALSNDNDSEQMEDELGASGNAALRSTGGVASNTGMGGGSAQTKPPIERTDTEQNLKTDTDDDF